MTAAIIGAVEVPYRRRPEPGVTTHTLLRDATTAVLEEAGLKHSDVDGFALHSKSLLPDHAIDVAWRLGLSLRWLLEDTNGGATGINMLGHAIAAIEAGDAEVIVIVGADVMDLAVQRQLMTAFNVATRDNLAPLGYEGPNGLFAMLTQRQMRATGLEPIDYGHIAVAQRAWAAKNPLAIYREPLTIADYMASPLVADPLRRFDCVPMAAGGDAIVVSTEDRARPGAAVRVRALRRSFNYDQQEGDGLTTALAGLRDELWGAAGVSPDDIDVAAIYDDYPAMVLAQLNDLGFVADGDLPRFVRQDIAERRRAINTSGGQLSVGHVPASAGLHGLVEAVRQLQHKTGERQVPNARLALATGYGMVLYRYCAGVGAVVLEGSA